MTLLFRNFLLLFLLTSTFASFSQRVIDLGTEVQNRVFENTRKANKKPINAIGSPYIEEAFTPIRIKGDDKVYPARYNAYNSEMEINLGKDEIVVLNPKNDQEVIFINTNTVYKAYDFINEEGKSVNGFLVLVSQTPEYALLKQERVKFYQAEEAQSAYEQSKPARFKKLNDKFYLKKESSFSYLPSNKKRLFKTFPEHSKQIKEYLKKNKLSLKKETDMIKIASFIASL